MKILTFILIILFIFTACDKDKAKTDEDVITDADIITDIDTAKDEDLLIPDNDTDIQPDIDIKKPDEETITDNDNLAEYEYCNPDSDIKNIWTPDGDPYAEMAAKYQYYPYIYYGDFHPEIKDPENVRRLWEKYYQQSKDQAMDCVPTQNNACWCNTPFEPVVKPEKNPLHTDIEKCSMKNDEWYYSWVQNECDTPIIAPPCWALDWTWGHERNYNIKNGKILFSMSEYGLNNSWQSSTGLYLYDIEKRQMLNFGKGLDEYFFNGRYLFMARKDTSKNHLYPETHPDTYEESAIYLTYYDTEENKWGYAYKGTAMIDFSFLFANDKYVMVSYERNRSDEHNFVMYTKIGEWDNWKELTGEAVTSVDNLVRAGHQTMTDHYAAFQNLDNEIYFCDLEKGTESCFMVSRTGFQSRHPEMIYNNSKKVVYYAETQQDDTTRKLIEADISDPENIKYKELLEYQDVISLQDINDTHILYTRSIGKDSYDRHILSLCYYRFSDSKNICLENDRDKGIQKDYSFMYEDKLIYQSWFEIIIRDMKCHCKAYPDECPYADENK